MQRKLSSAASSCAGKLAIRSKPSGNRRVLWLLLKNLYDVESVRRWFIVQSAKYLCLSDPTAINNIWPFFFRCCFEFHWIFFGYLNQHLFPNTFEIFFLIDFRSSKVCSNSFNQTLSHFCQLKLWKCHSAGGDGPSFWQHSLPGCVKSIFIFLRSVDGG